MKCAMLNVAYVEKHNPVKTHSVYGINHEWFCVQCLAYHNYDNTEEVILIPARVGVSTRIVMSRTQWTYILRDLRKPQDTEPKRRAKTLEQKTAGSGDSPTGS